MEQSFLAHRESTFFCTWMERKSTLNLSSVADYLIRESLTKQTPNAYTGLKRGTTPDVFENTENMRRSSDQPQVKIMCFE